MKTAIEIMELRAAHAAREFLCHAPEGSVRAVFAGGSVGRGEVWSASEGALLAIYSDIDLYVVLSEGSDSTRVRRAAEDATRAMPGTEGGVVFHRGVDFGIYPLDDLLAQPVRPGTVNLADHQVWLHGDRSILEPMRGAFSRPMASAEALYLLEHRAWDALEAVADAGNARMRANATAAKVVLDVMAAHLIAEGRFRPTYRARLAEYDARAPMQMSSRIRDAVTVAECIRNGDISSRLDPQTALAMVAETWCALAPLIVGDRGAASHDALVAARCRRGDWAGNLREFVRLRRTTGLSLGASTVVGWRYAALAPRAALRTHALVRALTKADGTATPELSFHTGYVSRLASRLGFEKGNLDERVHAAYRAVS